MAANYIPSRDADLSLWADNFRDKIVAVPATYGLLVGDANSIDTFVSDFITKLGLASNPSTRTNVSVANKEGAKSAMLSICRPYAQQIKSNLGVSDAAKLDLGLTLNDTTRTPIPPPSTAPLISPVIATPLQHQLRYADSASPDSRAKPAGVIGVQLFKFVGTVAPTSIDQFAFDAFVTRQPFNVNHREEDTGKTAYYKARFQNAKGEEGPWSATSHMTIVG